METKITLSDISLMLGISKHTLRYYDRVGLVEPKYDANGYRYYSFEHFYLLSTIKLLREMDVPIKEIKASIHERNLEDLTELLTKSKQYVDSEIRRLTKISHTLGETIKAAGDHERLSNKWFIHDRDAAEYYYFGGMDYEGDNGINLAKDMLKKHPNIMYENDMLVAYRRDDVERVVTGISEIYVPCEDVILEGAKRMILPAGTYATIYYKGSEESLRDGVESALKELREKGYCLSDMFYEHLRQSHLISSTQKTIFTEFMIQLL